MYYLDKVKDRIGNIDLFICMDSGSADYETLWLTSTLRGAIKGNLCVRVLD